MNPIRIENIANYTIKIENGDLVLLPKVPHLKQFKQDLPKRNPAPKTPDPNKYVERCEEFEDELWVSEGMISKGITYTVDDRATFLPCKCTKPILFHDLLPDKEWVKHRKEVNRYRRMCANARVGRPLRIDKLIVPEDSDDEYSMEGIIRRMDREELEADLNIKKVSFMSGSTDHELRALLCKAYDV